MITLENVIDEDQMHKLFEVWAYCDHFDKSTEFMLQYMQDQAKVDLDVVLQFMQEYSPNRKQWYSENANWLSKYNR